MCMCSPPYWGLRDYGMDNQIGLESTSEEYVQRLVAYFREVKKLLKKTGSLYLNLGDTYMKKSLQMIPARVAVALQSDGWILRNDIIWHKPNHMPSSVKDRLTNTYEHIFHFTKSRKYYYDLDSIRIPHKTGPASSDGRVRKTNLSQTNIVGITASSQGENGYKNKRLGKDNSVDTVRYSTKFDKNSQIYNLLQHTAYARKVLGREHNTALNHPLGKNPGDVVDWRAELKRTNRPLDPPPGISCGGGNLGLRRMNTEGRPLYPPHHSYRGDGWEASNPDIANHPFGKNPGDIYLLDETAKYKGKNHLRQDEHMGGKVGLAEFRERCRALGVVEGNCCGKNPGDFWEVKPKPFLGAHFAVYPEALCIKPILSSCPSKGIVLDPFAGAGTTMKVALDLGRNAIGIELNPNYVEIIQKRLDTAHKGKFICRCSRGRG